MIVLVLTGPLMAIAALGGVEPNAAIAPPTSDIPVPPGWSTRELETAAGSGSGGTFERFVVVTPDRSIGRADAEDLYRAFLTPGWDAARDPVAGGPSYRRGPDGSATILTLASDLAWEVNAYGTPPTADEFVVMAWYEDRGAAARAQARANFIRSSIAVTVAPGLFLVGLKRLRHRRSDR